MSKIYPVGGGKGGSGKSFLSANLGVLLTKTGGNVVLVDLDLGSSNLHTILGLNNPEKGLHDFLNKDCQSLDQTAVDTPIPNLHLISSFNCSTEIANLFYAQKLKIIRAIKKLPYDYVLIDLGAGTNFNTLDFFLTSNEGLFIITPEPTSIENAFRFAQAVCHRTIKHVLEQKDLKPIIQRITAESKTNTALSPSEIIQAITQIDPEKAKLMVQKLSELEFKFILNQFRKQTDVNLGDKIEKVCNRHFHSRFKFLGNVTFDEKVHNSILMKEVYINKYPYTLTAIDLQNISRTIAEKGSHIQIPLWKT